MSKVALITGVTGQDGSYLAEVLLEKGYQVHGLTRRTSMFNRGRIEELRREVGDERFALHYGDLGDSSSLHRVVGMVRPDEIYNLAAQSHVGISFDQPEYTTDVTGTGVLRLLEAVRSNGLKSRFYQASTSELYGKVQAVPQDEATPFFPQSPYATAKLYAYWITQNYREAYGVHASNGILFNHESPIRGETFVTRKITRAVAAIELGLQDILWIGNLDARRDWGHARDYVRGMWLIAQQERADDYVLATGEAHSVREFVDLAFAQVGKEIVWQGSGSEERGVDRASGAVLVRVDPRYFRPLEVAFLLGDASKAHAKLGWRHETSFAELVREMVAADLETVRREGRNGKE